MKKLCLLVMTAGLAACAFPYTPRDGDLLNGAKQFQPELFESGARGQAIVFLSDNVSKGGFFGKKYRNVIAFKNLQSGAVFYLETKLDDKDFDTAMLPVGKYAVANLYMEYIYTTTYRQGNTTVVETHIEKHEHFEGNKKITFEIKPREVAYLGHIEILKGDNVADKEGATVANGFKITDKSADIPEDQKQKWKKKFGVDFVARPASVAK
ncbi:MAG: hypothetical protein LBD94_01430 [Rickettsiales bacterium]|jgi:hypothetical protein|nr:hypothetical protein [Rickettsiales bacterium]